MTQAVNSRNHVFVPSLLNNGTPPSDLSHYYYPVYIINPDLDSALFLVPLRILQSPIRETAFACSIEEKGNIKKRQLTYLPPTYEVQQIKPLKIAGMNGLKFKKLFSNFTFEEHLYRFSPGSQIPTHCRYFTLEDFATALCDTSLKKNQVKLLALGLINNSHSQVLNLFQDFKGEIALLLERYKIFDPNIKIIMLWDLLFQKIILTSPLDKPTQELLSIFFFKHQEDITLHILYLTSKRDEKDKKQILISLEKSLSSFQNDLKIYSQCATVHELSYVDKTFHVFIKKLCAIANFEDELHNIPANMETFFQRTLNDVFSSVHSLHALNDGANPSLLLTIIENYLKSQPATTPQALIALKRIEASVEQIRHVFSKNWLNIDAYIAVTQFRSTILLECGCVGLEFFCERLFQLSTALEKAYFQEAIENFVSMPLFSQMKLSFKKLSFTPLLIKEHLNELNEWADQLASEKHSDLLISINEFQQVIHATEEVRTSIKNDMDLANIITAFCGAIAENAVSHEIKKLYYKIAQHIQPYLILWNGHLLQINHLITSIQDISFLCAINSSLPACRAESLCNDFQILNKKLKALIKPVTIFFNSFINLLSEDQTNQTINECQINFSNLSQEDTILNLFCDDLNYYKELEQQILQLKLEKLYLKGKAAALEKSKLAVEISKNTPCTDPSSVTNKLTLEQSLKEVFTNTKTQHVLGQIVDYLNNLGISYSFELGKGSHRHIRIGDICIPYPGHKEWKPGTSASIQRLLKAAILKNQTYQEHL